MSATPCTGERGADSSYCAHSVRWKGPAYVLIVLCLECTYSAYPLSLCIDGVEDLASMVSMRTGCGNYRVRDVWWVR